MERGYDEFELVHVIKPFRLVDAESYERVYRRSDGAALANGYYIVSWSPRARQRAFDENAVFQGPFRERARAAKPGASEGKPRRAEDRLSRVRCARTRGRAPRSREAD